MSTTTLKKKNSFSIGQYSYILICLVLFAAYWIINGRMSLKLFTNIFMYHSAIIGVLGLGMGMIIITGDIDLSVGAILSCIASFACVIFNLLVLANVPSGLVITITVLFCIVGGTLLGFVNGAMIGKLKLPAFIVTLATQLIYRSVSKYACNIIDNSVTGGTGSGNVYKLLNGPARDGMYAFGNRDLFGALPYIGLLFLVIAVILIYISTSTKYGKRLYAIGSNAKAAHMAGVNVEWNRTSVFTITGLLCGNGAIMWLGQQSGVDPSTAGVSNEMYAIAAVVLGGIAMSGGKGRMLGIVFGTFSYTLIDKIINAMNVSSLVNDSIKGAILLVAIVIQVLGPQLRKKHGE